MTLVYPNGTVYCFVYKRTIAHTQKNTIAHTKEDTSVHKRRGKGAHRPAQEAAAPDAFPPPPFFLKLTHAIFMHACLIFTRFTPNIYACDIYACIYLHGEVGAADR